MNLGQFFFGLLLFFSSLFLIMIILVQRGRGGGLAGALGGAGGQSAFGAKAGDTFTRITVVTAIVWIALCMLTIRIFNPVVSGESPAEPEISASVPALNTGEEDGDEGDDDGGMGASDEAGGIPEGDAPSLPPGSGEGGGVGIDEPIDGGAAAPETPPAETGDDGNATPPAESGADDDGTP